ncbi:hypothetical protein MPH_08911 [Macrophomina phaseolina MS6]|uniref:Apple domain-containing protein n=1 Tax=Macrophomina phaseolina (strain MS6) TaxID=1126212 RepID=K2RM66_MACPH|nr:hypothetical protein MPH_08911 [Macrophomina phaseolina MS6]
MLSGSGVSTTGSSPPNTSTGSGSPQPPISGTGTTSATSTASPTTVSCPVSNGTTYQAVTVPNSEFYLECGIDYADNNIEFPPGYQIQKRDSIQDVSFYDCVEFCARLCDCVDVTYSFSARTCQPKSAFGQRVAVQNTNNVINARRTKPGCVSSSFSSSSSAARGSATPTVSTYTMTQSVTTTVTMTDGSGTVIVTTVITTVCSTGTRNGHHDASPHWIDFGRVGLQY